jgi:hypothetical protein
MLSDALDYALLTALVPARGGQSADALSRRLPHTHQLNVPCQVHSPFIGRPVQLLADGVGGDTP